MSSTDHRDHRKNKRGFWSDNGSYDNSGLSGRAGRAGRAQRTLTVRATADGGNTTEFRVRVRIDTPTEIEYYRHGGILLYVLRSLLG